MSAPTAAEVLRLTHGVAAEERDHVVDLLQRLDHRLRSFPEDAVELSLSVKERDTPTQRTTLQGWIAGYPHMVATLDHPDFDAAVVEVRDELIRQITDAKNRKEPRNNRAGRQTL